MVQQQPMSARSHSSVKGSDETEEQTEASAARDPLGWKDDVYVELRSDPMAGGFLRKDSAGHWDVWPRMGGKTFQGFLGYGYNRVKAAGGRVAQKISPARPLKASLVMAITA